MIHATPARTSEATALLEQIDAIHAELAHELGRAAPWDGTLRRDARFSSIVSSTSIEGFSVSDDEARTLISGGQPADDDEHRWAIACYARAMEHVRIMGDDPSFRWLDRVILDLHFDACIFQRTKSPGRWRTGPIGVTAPPGGHHYDAPQADDVPALVDAMLTSLIETADEHLLIRGAMAHLHLVSIHPFRDGNGRISRIVQSLVLARGGVLAPEFASIEPYLARHTDEYYRQLQQAQGPTYDPRRDASDWVHFCLHAHLEQARDYRERMRAIADRWRRLEAYVSMRGWPERIVVAMEQSLAGELARARYADEVEIALPTATLDLRRLVDAGLIEPRGGGRATSYVATDALRNQIE